MRPLVLRTEIAHFETTLRAGATPDRAQGEKRYLKSELVFLGATLPDVRRTVKAWLGEHPNLTRVELVRLVRALWRRRVHELRMTAAVLLQNCWPLLDPSDLDLLEDLLRHSKTWAYVDAIAVHVVGPLVERNPALGRALDRWAGDHDFWIRRSALLALLSPLRRGEGDWRRFARFADSMLDEKEFFIGKAIGWVLREVSKTTPERVLEFLEPRLDRTSGLTFREATKYLPERTRARLAKLRG